VPVGQLEGVGEKIRDRLIEADISSVQRLAATPVEMLAKIEGIGPKTAEKLIERANVVIAEVEREFEQKRLEEEQTAAATEEAADKLEESDVFEDDEDFIIDADDMPEVMAPEIDDSEDVEDEEVPPPSKDSE
jgi:5'-3' exonuclease